MAVTFSLSGQIVELEEADVRWLIGQAQPNSAVVAELEKAIEAGECTPGEPTRDAMSEILGRVPAPPDLSIGIPALRVVLDIQAKARPGN